MTMPQTRAPADRRTLQPAALLRLMRPRQWIKNGFVLAPLFFTPEAVTVPNLVLAGVAFVVFCLISGAVYAINDSFDREADRQHPAKRLRPLASGAVSLPQAAALAAALIVAAGILAWAVLPLHALLLAFLYLAVNLGYSLVLKRIAILDVILIAIGFVLRVDAGAAAISVEPSAWITVCTGLLALFIALAKRRDDLVRALGADHRRSLAGYNLRFIDAALAMVLGALVVSYTIYTLDAGVMTRFGTNKVYFTLPFVIAGVLRYLQITLVEERSGSPTDLAVTDRFLVAAVVGWLITFAIVLYG